MAKQRTLLEKIKLQRDDALSIILHGRKINNEELRRKVETEEMLRKE